MGLKGLVRKVNSWLKKESVGSGSQAQAKRSLFRSGLPTNLFQSSIGLERSFYEFPSLLQYRLT